jgi:hypothetical protein
LISIPSVEPLPCNENKALVPDDKFADTELPKFNSPVDLTLADWLYPIPSVKANHSNNGADCETEAPIDKPVVPAEAVRIFSIDKLGTVPIPTLPPTITDPPIPTPPVTINAPVEDELVATDDVIAKPETVKISVDGLNTNVLSFETAAPEAVPNDGLNNKE